MSTQELSDGVRAELEKQQARVNEGEPVSSVAGESYFRAVQVGFEGPQSAWAKLLLQQRKEVENERDEETRQEAEEVRQEVAAQGTQAADD